MKKFILFIIVFIMLTTFAYATATVLDNFEYGSDTDLNNAYNGESDAGSSITLSRSTDAVEGTYSMQAVCSYDGDMWDSAVAVHFEASSFDLTSAEVVKISIKGDANFAGVGTFILKFNDSSSESIRYVISGLLEQTSWVNLEIPISSFEEDPYDANPGTSANRSDILSWSFYFQNTSTSAFSGTVLVDNFEWDDEATPPSPITIDGSFSDWQASDQIDVLPNEVEDNSEGVDPDIVDVWVSNDDYYLYVSVLLDNGIDFDSAIRHIDVFVDSDMNDATGMTYGWWITGCDKRADVYSASGLGGTYEDYDSSAGGNWGWTFFGDMTSGTDFAWGTVSVSNDRVELRIARSWLGDEGSGNQSRIVIGTQYNWNGIDYAPSSLGSQTYVYTYVEGVTPPIPTYIVNSISASSAPNVLDDNFDTVYVSEGVEIATWKTDGEVDVGSPYNATRAYMLTDKEKIYFGIKIGDNDTSTLQNDTANDTYSKWNVDSWEIVFAPNPFTIDGVDYYKFTGDSADYYDDMFPDSMSGTTSYNAPSFQYNAYIIDANTWAAEFSVDVVDMPGMMTHFKSYGHIGIQAKDPVVNYAYPKRASFGSRDVCWDLSALMPAFTPNWSLYE